MKIAAAHNFLLALQGVKESPGPQERRAAAWRQPGQVDPRRHLSNNAKSAGTLRLPFAILASPRKASQGDNGTESCTGRSVARTPAPYGNGQSRCHGLISGS